MIYAHHFEIIWPTFWKKFAPAKQIFGSLQVVIRIMNDKLQEAEEDKQKLNKQVLWLSYLCMTNDCPLEMIYDSLFGSRAGMSRAKYTRVKEESARNEGLYTPLTVGVFCPAELSFQEPYSFYID